MLTEKQNKKNEDSKYFVMFENKFVFRKGSDSRERKTATNNNVEILEKNNGDRQRNNRTEKNEKAIILNH